MIKKSFKLKYLIPSFFVALFLSINLTTFFNQEEFLALFFNSQSIFLFIVLFLVTFFLYFKSSQFKFSKKKNIYIIFSAILIGLITTLGQGFAIDESWSIYFSSPVGMVVFLLKWLGFSSIIYDILRIIIKILTDKKYLKVKALKWQPSILKLFLIVFLPKLLPIIFFFPGNLDVNSQNSLMEYYSLNNLGESVNGYSSGNPWLAVNFYGIFNDIGNLFGNSNIGYLLIALVQTALFSFAFALIVYQLIRWKLPKWLPISMLIIYSIAPVWLVTSVYLIKDVIYFGLLAVWYIIFIRLVDRHLLSIFSATGFALLSVLLILFRTSSVFIVLPGFLIIIWFLAKGFRTRFSASSIFVVVGLPILTILFLVLNSSNFQKQIFNRYPNFAIQQIARTFANDQDQINPKIKDDLRSIVDADTANEKYQARIADPILANVDQKAFDSKFEGQSKQTFWSEWWTLLKQFPAEFAQGFFGLNYQYYYPLTVNRTDSSGDAVWSVDVQSNVYQNREQLLKKLNYHYLFPTELRYKISTVLKNIDNFPLINWITNGGFYGLLLLFLFGYSILNKKKTLIVSGIPLVLIWLLNLNAPVNGLLRYNLPILAIFPLYLGYFTYKINSSK